MSEKARKFQPHITPETAYSLKTIPKSINCVTLSIKALEEAIKNNPECYINYVVTDESGIKEAKDRNATSAGTLEDLFGRAREGEIKNIKFMSQNSGDKGFPSIVFNPSANEVKNTFSSDAAVIVCPNPVCDYITVSGKEDSDEIILRGMDGSVVSRTYGSIVEVRDLPLGNYILSVNNKSVKFIKR